MAAAAFSRAVPFGGLALVLAPFIIASLAVISEGIPDYPTSGDEALLEMSTRNTASGATLTGPYSRFGFNHPGPMYFFLRIPLYYLSGFAASSSYLTVCLLGLLCLTGIFAIFRRHVSDMAALLFCLVGSLYMKAIGPVIWLNDWNAFVIVLPLLFLFVSLCAACMAEGRWLPAAVVAGSFAAQTHLGSVPTVFAAFASVLLLLLTKRASAWRGLTSRLWLSAAIAAVLWLPVVYQELASRGLGNISALAAFFLESKPEAAAVDAFRGWLASLSSMETVLVPPGLIRRLGIVTEFFLALAVLRMVLLTASLILLRRKQGNSFLQLLCAMALVAHFITLLSALEIREEPHQFLFVWMSFVGPLSWLAIIASLSSRPARDRPGSLPSLVVLALTAIVSAPNIGSGASVLSAIDTDPRVGSLAVQLARHPDVRDGPGAYVLLGDHGLWPVMTGIVNYLQKAGCPVELDPAFRFMSGVMPDSCALPILLSSDSLWISGFAEVARCDGALLGIPAR